MISNRALIALFVFRFAAVGQTSPPVPTQYQSLYTELQGDVTAFSQSMGSGSNGTGNPSIYAAQAMTANSDIGPSLFNGGYYSGTVLPELQELQALGVTAVTVHINFPVLYAPYFSNDQDFKNYVTFYQQLAQQIRSNGMKLIVETSVASPEGGPNGAAFLSYYEGLSWSDFIAGRAQQAVTIAQMIQPDYMSVITEPDFEAQNSGQPGAGTPDGSLQELQTIVAAVQNANITDVPIGAGAGTWIDSFAQYIQNFVTVPIGYIDVHMYSVSNRFPQNALSAATMAHSAGLPVAMSEAWCKKISAAGFQANPGALEGQAADALDTFSFWEPLDQMFLQSLVKMSQAGQFLFISPSWTGFYFASLDYGQYGTQPASQVITASQTAAISARQIGAFAPLGPAWEAMILPSPDTTAPQVPATPLVGEVNQTFIQVLWSPSADNVGVAGYNLYRNGTLVYTSSQVNFNDNSLSAFTTYSYQLQAFDAAGNLSGLSAPAIATTLLNKDSTPPSTPTNLQASLVSRQIQLTWSPATDNFAIGGYEVLRGSSPSSLAAYASVTATSFADNQTTPNTTYYFAVEAFDPSGNYSAQSAAIAVTSSNGINLPGPIPAAYQSLYNELQGDIASFSQAISTSSTGSTYPTLFASQALTANSDMGPALLGSYYYTGSVLPELQELQALGATAISVHINFPVLYEPYYGNQQTFQSYITFYQQVAQQIHSMGMKMCVETTVASAMAGTNGSTFLPYYQGLSWNDYMNGRAQQAVTIAQLIQPDFMSVITEPDSESQNSAQANAGTPSGSLQELQTILAAIQAANITNVPVGAGAGTWISSFTTYIQNVLSTTISYVDLHMYSVSYAFPENTLTAASMAHAAGLPITMSETWCKKIAASQLQGIAGALDNEAVDALGVFSFWEPLDQQFLQALVNMSQAGQFTFVSPFWTSLYFAYLDYGQYGSQTSEQIITASESAASGARQAGSFSTVGPAWENLIIASPDQTAPLVPAAPSIGQYGQTTAQVLWTPTTDNVGVAGYNLYRNGTLLNTSSQVNFIDNSVSPSTPYSYQVQAFDASGNISALSAPASVTTLSPPDNTPPSTPMNLQGTALSDQALRLTWSPSTDNVSIAGYRVFRGTSANSLALFAVVTVTSFTDTNSIYPNSIFYYAVEAIDPSYNYSAQSAIVAVTAFPDTTPPTAPANVTAVGAGYQQVNLTWTASTDDFKVVGYTIYRGKTTSSMTAVGNTASTSFADTISLLPGTTYYYSVCAYDAAPNYSAQSPAVTAITVADTQPPTVPQNVAAIAAGMQQVNLTWSVSTDNVLVAGYNIYRGKTAVSMAIVGSTTATSFIDTVSLTPGTMYYYSVLAFDEVLNNSPQSPVTTTTTIADTQPPTVPRNLAAAATGMQQVNLTWSGATDNVMVAGYNIYRGKTVSSMAIVGSTTATSFTDILGLTPGMAYYYAVAAVDEVQNVSAQSGIASATTMADTQAPSVPQNLVAAATGMQQANLTWSASTDNVLVAGYTIFRGKTASSLTVVGSSTTTSFADVLGLTPGATYYYAVTAFDEVLNNSAQSSVAAATTAADTQPPTAPRNLAATAAGMQQINLTWSASADNVIVAGYTIYRGKTLSSMAIVGSSTATSLTDTVSLVPGTTYYYAAVAFDEVLNNSAQSPVATATTAADTQSPTAPQNLTAAGAGMQKVNLTWSASTDNVMVAGYTIYRGKMASSLAIVGTSTTGSFTDTISLQPGTLYYYAVTAYDQSGNNSAQSGIASATTTPDTQPPSVPQNLQLAANSGTQINLTWSPSADNVGVYSYRIYRGTSAGSLTLIGSSSTAAYSDASTLKANVTYYYAVAAVDASGNASADSAVASVVNP